MQWCLRRKIDNVDKNLVNYGKHQPPVNQNGQPIYQWKLPTRCILEGETVIQETVKVVSGVNWVLKAPPFSSFSSAISPKSSSFWFTSFKRSITSSMDTGSWRRRLVSLAYTSRGDNSPHHETTTNLLQVIRVIDLRQVSSELLEEHDTTVLCLLHPTACLLRQPFADLLRISMKGSLYYNQINWRLIMSLFHRQYHLNSPRLGSSFFAFPSAKKVPGTWYFFSSTSFVLQANWAGTFAWPKQAAGHWLASDCKRE